jgi:hypothetical protein
MPSSARSAPDALEVGSPSAVGIAREVWSMAKRIITAVFALFWGYCAYVGFDLVSNVAKRGVPGYPNSGQWGLYVVFPTAMLLLSIALVVLSKRVPRALYVGLLILEIVPILPFLMVYGGGV